MREQDSETTTLHCETHKNTTKRTIRKYIDLHLDYLLLGHSVWPIDRPFWGTSKQTMAESISYHHYSLTFDPNDVATRFKDVRFLLVAGCSQRAESQGSYLVDNLFDGIQLPKHSLEQLTKAKSRFTLFKVGPVLLSNHGMGCASMSIALHELFLMCQQANIMNLITVIRFGTCEYLVVVVHS